MDTPPGMMRLKLVNQSLKAQFVFQTYSYIIQWLKGGT
jgi:hypothetical protein